MYNMAMRLGSGTQNNANYVTRITGELTKQKRNYFT